MSGARVLIVKTSSMGDVVHALPMASDIARARPDLAIDWVVEESFAAIPRLHPAVDRVIPIALRRWRKAPFARTTRAEVHAALAQLRAEAYEAVIDCQGLLKSAVVAGRTRGPVWGLDRASAREPLAALLYRHRVPVPTGLHAIARNRLLGAAAFRYDPEGAPRFGLRVPAATPPVAAGRPYAVLLTNASRATKLWPAERWQAVEAALAAQGLCSLLFWGSDDERLATERRAAAMRDARVAPRTGLAELAALLAGARVVVGLDTGLTHLAAAVGAPTLGLFCDYDPALVGVTGDACCESLGGVDDVPSADAALAAVARLLGGKSSA